MSSEGQAEKTQNFLQRENTLVSQKNDLPSFTQKVKEIKQLLKQYLSAEKFSQLENHLEELNEIYHSDIAGEKGIKQKGLQQKEGMTGFRGVRRTEKVILECLEGKKMQNQIKIEGETRGARSPDKKVEQKKFMKFEPKRVTAENQSNLGGIRKNSANK